MTPARMCERCGARPQGYHDRRWCYDCKPGSKGRPLPCKRCGAIGDYWAAGLCRRCHQYAPQAPESCRDCLAWGVRRTDKWLCGGCISWPFLHPGVKTCIGCGEQRCVNDHDACRLCWGQAKLIRAHVGRGRRATLDVKAANRHGQQLFLANLASSKIGYRPRPGQPETLPAALRKPRTGPSRRKAQLDLFARDPIADAARGYGFPDPPNQRIADGLDEIARDHAARHGWADKKTHVVRTAIRVLLGMCHVTQLPIRASDVSQLHAVELRVRPVIEVIAEADLLEDDRTATIDAWFAARIHGLPPTMTGELQIWFEVLRHGSNTPPRSRPRVPGTITTRLTRALPTLRAWAGAGCESLREITRDDVLAALPASGNPRAKLGHALRSIFGILKAHKVVFLNPTARIAIGSFTRRIPLPAEPAQLRAALNSAHPTSAALAALVIFHGLRPAELRDLQLTDVRDGRIHLPGRTMPLAEPAKARVAAYLRYRHSSWPGSVNPHFFIHRVSAGTTSPAAGHWINRNIGMSAQAARQDRIIDEVQATAGDLRRICDFFGVTMATAEYYATTLNHPGLNNTKLPNANAGSTTQGQD